MESKHDTFVGVKLEEIHSCVKDNGRNIADANLRLMTLDDDVKEIKELLKLILEKLV